VSRRARGLLLPGRPTIAAAMRRVIGLLAAWCALAVAGAACAQQAPPSVQEGSRIFKRACLACHPPSAGTNRLGPSLFGVVGRLSGALPGYNYSEAMKKAGVTWNDQSLDKYLADPKAFIPGNRMVYAGLKKTDQRADLVAYLKTLQ
jgi:cytochrome c